MKKIRLIGFSLALLLLAFWVGIPPLKTAVFNGPLHMDDVIDQQAIFKGLVRTHSFSQAWAWWTGPWVGYWGDGQVNSFYRPLTSLVWYTQYRLWGPNGTWPFMVMHFVWHLVVCLLAVAFFRHIVGYRIALAAIVIWASGFLFQLTLPAPQAALYWWKDDPDLWISISVLLTLWSLLSYWRTSKSRFLISAVLFQIVGIAFKEMAYVTPVMAGLVLWSEWRKHRFAFQPRHWAPIVGLVSIVILAYIFRTWALQGPGFRFGSNGSWLERWVLYNIGGRSASLALAGELGSTSMALTALGLAALAWKKWKAGAVVLACGLALMLWFDGSRGQLFATPIQFLSSSPSVPFWKMPIVQDSLQAFLIFVLWTDFFNRRDPRQVFGYGWMLFAYLPLLTAPITEHALYLPSMGWALFLAVALDNVIRDIRAAVSKRKNREIGILQPTPLEAT
ncbi:hypothetical protein EON80_21035 [bacterium]|nr:MAG: hypothetical protein EON80_21035 [bacterium]